MDGLSLVLVTKWFVFTLLSSAYCYFFGHSLTLFFTKKRVFGIENLAIGFLCLLSVLQFFTWFMVGFSFPFQIFVITLAVIMVVILLFCVTINRNFLENVQSKTRRTVAIEEKIILVSSLLVCALQIVMTCIKYRSDGDDAFYVGNSAAFLNDIILNWYDASTGIKTIAPLSMYNNQIWEVFLSFMSKMTGIEPVIFIHTVLIPVLICISASAYLMLGKKIFEKRTSAHLFYILISLYHFMGGCSVYSQGSFLLSRIWQGKAVYLNIVLPILMVWMLDIFENPKNKLNYLKISCCMLAGLALNPSSMYVLGFEILAMLMVIAMKKRSASVFRFAIPVVVMVFVFSLLLYFETDQYKEYISAVSTTDFKMIIQIFMNYFGSGFAYFFLFLCAMIVIMKLGNEKAKLVFCYTSLFLFMTVWNPVSGKYIAQNITKTPAYWRVFWLLPIGTSIACAMVFLFEKYKFEKYRFKQFKQVGLVLFFAVVMILPGKWMFTTENNFVNCTNVEKLPSDVLSFGKIIEEDDTVDKKVLAPYRFHTSLRQKYTDLEMVISRYLAELYFYRGESAVYEEKMQLNNFIECGGEIDYTNISILLKKYSVEWIIIKDERIEDVAFLQENKYQMIEKENGYFLFKK